MSEVIVAVQPNPVNDAVDFIGCQKRQVIFDACKFFNVTNHLSGDRVKLLYGEGGLERLYIDGNHVVTITPVFMDEKNNAIKFSYVELYKGESEDDLEDYT